MSKKMVKRGMTREILPRMYLSTYLRKQGISSSMVGDISRVQAVGGNCLGGGIGDTGVYLFDTIKEAEEFVRADTISRNVIYVRG